MDVDGDQTKPTHKTVFFGGIHPKVTKAMLQSFCESEFGPVENVQLIWDYNTGQSKGYGFVHFANVEDALAVKSLGTVRFFGREMNVGDAMLSNRRNKLCKYYFETGRCSKPNCGFAHSLAALQGNVQQLSSQSNAPNFAQNMADYLDMMGPTPIMDMDAAYLEQAITALSGGAPTGDAGESLYPAADEALYADPRAAQPRFDQPPRRGWSGGAAQPAAWPEVPHEEPRQAWNEWPQAPAAPAAPPKDETLQPRLQLINGTYCLVVPLQTVVQNQNLLPLLGVCTGQGAGPLPAPAAPAPAAPVGRGQPPAGMYGHQQGAPTGQPRQQNRPRGPPRAEPKRSQFDYAAAAAAAEELDYYARLNEEYASAMDPQRAATAAQQQGGFNTLEEEGLQELQQQLRSMIINGNTNATSEG